MEVANTPDPGDRFLLELSSKRIDFQPVSKDVSVFYDESNKQVFIIWYCNDDFFSKSCRSFTRFLSLSTVAPRALS